MKPIKICVDLKKQICLVDVPSKKRLVKFILQMSI